MTTSIGRGFVIANKMLPPTERLIAENVPEAVWLRFRRLVSTRLCEKLIAAQAPGLSPEILKTKASGMAWAVRSALGYWDTQEGGLNSKILSRYYALLQISIAEQAYGAWLSGTALPASLLTRCFSPPDQAMRNTGSMVASIRSW